METIGKPMKNLENHMKHINNKNQGNPTLMLSACPVGGWRDRVEAATVLRPGLRSRGCGRSEVSGAEPEGRRRYEVGVFGAGHCFRS